VPIVLVSRATRDTRAEAGDVHPSDPEQPNDPNAFTADDGPQWSDVPPPFHPEPGADRQIFVLQVVTTLVARTELPRALVAAVDGGAVERERFWAVILEATAFAARCECTATEVRRVVDVFARVCLTHVGVPDWRDGCARRAAGFVDALYLVLGRRGFTADLGAVTAAIPELLDGDGSAPPG
jgi:hypothetical protein